MLRVPPKHTVVQVLAVHRASLPGGGEPSHDGGGGSLTVQDMTSRTSPRQRPSQAVYRRRRLVALLILLVVLGGIAWGVSALLSGDGEPANAAPADAQPTETATPTPEPPSGEVVPCGADELSATVRTPPSPQVGSTVTFEVTVRNEGPAPCLLDAGPASLVASVTSGSDPVWSSAHCSQDSRELLLDTGARYTVQLPWDARRSTEGCEGDRPWAGAGTYRLALALGEEPVGTENGTVFTLG